MIRNDIFFRIIIKFTLFKWNIKNLINHIIGKFLFNKIR